MTASSRIREELKAMDNLLASVQDERKKYGAMMSDDECARLCNAVAWRHRASGWGLSGKRSGTRGRLPNGTEVAHDVLHHQPSHMLFDVLIGAGAQATPTWTELGVQQNLTDRPWIAPIDPGGTPPEPKPMPPLPLPTPATPSVVDLSRIERELVGISDQLAELIECLDAVQDATLRTALVSENLIRPGSWMAGIHARLDALKAAVEKKRLW